MERSNQLYMLSICRNRHCCFCGVPAGVGLAILRVQPLRSVTAGVSGFAACGFWLPL